MLHPAAMLAPEIGLDDGRDCALVHSFSRSFSREHLPMSLHFAAPGAGVGLAHGFYRHAIARKSQRLAMLEGLLPVCSGCKRIRDERAPAGNSASWVPLEVYVGERTNAVFSHSICPQCRAALYPNLRARAPERGDRQDHPIDSCPC